MNASAPIAPSAITESRLLHDVLRTFGRGQNFRLSRHNTGVGKYCPQCERAHRTNGHQPYRMVKYGIAGAPDIIGILAPGGRTIALETKSETGVVSGDQKAYHAMLERFGGQVRVVRSVDEAAEWMHEIGAVWK